GQERGRDGRLGGDVGGLPARGERLPGTGGGGEAGARAGGPGQRRTLELVVGALGLAQPQLLAPPEERGARQREQERGRQPEAGFVAGELVGHADLIVVGQERRVHGARRIRARRFLERRGDAAAAAGLHALDERGGEREVEQQIELVPALPVVAG